MRGVIVGATVVLILSFMLLITYLSPTPHHGVEVEMVGCITPKTLEKGIHQTIYGICNRSYYVIEIRPLLNSSSMLILNICYDDDCKTYRKVLKESESLTLYTPYLSKNESLNVSISGSIVSPTDNRTIEKGRVELKFIGICEKNSRSVYKASSMS